jgi:hypothetical protein
MISNAIDPELTISPDREIAIVHLFLRSSRETIMKIDGRCHCGYVGHGLGRVHWSKEASSFGLAFPWPKVGINRICPWRIGTMVEAIIFAIHGLQRPASRLVPGGKFSISAIKWFGFFGQRSAFFGQPFMDLCVGIEIRASDELMPCTRAKTCNPCSSRRECAFGTPRDRGMRVP